MAVVCWVCCRILWTSTRCGSRLLPPGFCTAFLCHTCELAAFEMFSDRMSLTMLLEVLCMYLIHNQMYATLCYKCGCTTIEKVFILIKPEIYIIATTFFRFLYRTFKIFQGVKNKSDSFLRVHLTNKNLFCETVWTTTGLCRTRRKMQMLCGEGGQHYSGIQ